MAADLEPADGDTLRLCVATDTHIGYLGKDKVRSDDSLNTFEEVLQICRGNRADFILHGGDLFHENKPHRGCLYRTMELLRQYCLGPGDVTFQVVSDPGLFSRGLVNYQDPNINVEMPIFMIHGNHDDPGGDSNLSVANLLEVASLVNYFGRSQDLENIVVKPVLLRKGATQVAIYGLGNIRDERLNRAFQAKKIRFEAPANPEQWFNIMILHQNRHKGSKGGVPSKACIHEDMLPSFLDLVIWGHEHDCEVMPVESLKGEFYVVQPGSSVATSLSQGETKMKHVAVIDVKQGAFRCTPMPLWSVRPLVMGEVSLADSGLLRTDTHAIWNHLKSKVDELILQGEEDCRARKRELAARASSRGSPALAAPQIPLVRLRVEHSGFDTISGQSFGQHFAERVANPEDILLFHKRAGGGGAGGAVGNKLFSLGDVLEIEAAPDAPGEGVKIQDIIYRYIDGGQNLQILSEPDLNDAVQAFVHRAEACAIERFVRQAVDSTNTAVLRDSRAAGEDEIRVQIQDRAEGLRQQRLAGAAAPGGAPGMPPAPEEPADSLLRGPPGSLAKAELIEAEDPPPSAASAVFNASQQPAPRGRGGRGRGRGRGRGAEKREPDAGLFDAVMPAAKVARGNSVLRASSGSLPQPAGSSLREAMSRHEPAAAFGGSSQAPAASSLHAVDTAAPAAAAPVQTGFLQKRGGLAAEANPVAPVSDPVAAPKPRPQRQWALR